MTMAGSTTRANGALGAAGGRARRQAGFSLVELMIVIAISAILATIATANYKSYALRANRTEARQALLSIQAAQEKYFLQNNSYATTVAQFAAAVPAGLGVQLDAIGNTPAGHYRISVVAATATSYTIKATAVGTQVKDDASCLTFRITDRGVMTPAATSNCWH